MTVRTIVAHPWPLFVGALLVLMLATATPVGAQSSTAVFHGRVALPARGPSGSPTWQVPLTVEFLREGTDVVLFSANPTTTSTGAFTASLPTGGDFDVRVKYAQSVSVVDLGAQLIVGDNPNVDFGTLQLGDVNDDDSIDLLDFSQLRTAFGSCDGDSAFLVAADLNGDGCVDLLDFSILRTAFGQSGPVLLGTVWPPTTCPGILPATISTNTTIGPGCYVMNGTSTVAAGVTLTIRAGTAIKVTPVNNHTRELTVDGVLTARATTDAPIVFTALADDSVGGDTNHDGNATLPVPGDYLGLVVGATGAADLDHVTVQYAFTGVGVSGSVAVANSTFRNNSHFGLNVDSSSLTVVSSTFDNNVPSGLCGGNNDCGGISFSGANLTVIGSTFTGNYFGIVGSGLSHVTLSDDQFTAQTQFPIQLGLVGAMVSLDRLIGASNGNNAVGLAGSIGSDLTLPIIPGIPNYVLDNTLTVNPGVTLTLPAGSVIKTTAGNNFSRTLTVNGTLIAHGTAAAPVVFTAYADDAVGGDTNNDGAASTPAPGQYGGLRVNSAGSADFDHVIEQYAFSGAGVTGSLAVANSTFRNNTHFGINADSASLSVHNSTFDNNIPSGLCSGNNDCGGISFSGSSLTVDDSIFTNNYFGIVASGVSQLHLTNDSFSGQSQFPINLPGLVNASLTLNNLSGSNNGNNAVGLSGSIGASVTLPVIPGIPDYVLDNTVTVNQGATLTLPEGSVIKITSGNNFSRTLTVNGSLIAHGTAAAPIAITAYADDSVGGDTNNDGVATVPAAGQYGGLRINSTGTMSLDHALVRYSFVGALNSGGGFAATNSAFTNNVTGVSQSGASSGTSIHSSSFVGNTQFGVRGDSATNPVDATLNWWGAATGPSPLGAGDAVNSTSFVIVIPFLTSPP